MENGPVIEVNLRLRHPSLPAGQLNEYVGLKPSVARDVGTTAVSIGGKTRTNTKTYCSYPLYVGPIEAMNEALWEGLGILERSEAFWKGFLVTGGSIDFFVGIFVDFSMGVTITADLLAKMGEWKVDLGLDIYGAIDQIGDSQTTKP